MTLRKEKINIYYMEYTLVWILYSFVNSLQGMISLGIIKLLQFYLCSLGCVAI